MSRKRPRREIEDRPLQDFNSKRPPHYYDLRHKHSSRQCCSLPQYHKRQCQHGYHLRSFEHRQPVNYLGPKETLYSPYDARRKRDVCMKIQESTEIDSKRNAHSFSYSMNGQMGRCSNSSSISGRRRNVPPLKKGAPIIRTTDRNQVSNPL